MELASPSSSLPRSLRLERAVTITVTIAVGTEDVVIAAAISAIAHQALMIPRAPSRGHSIGPTVVRRDGAAAEEGA